MKTFLSRGAALTVAAFIAGSALSAAAEERTVDAFATWSARGEVYQTNVNEATFVGALNGVVYVETDRGPVNGGEIHCPATIKIDTTTAKQAGGGACTIVAQDGAMLFAEWACTGVHLAGCDGMFVVIGGTERLDGVSGKGPIVIRSELHDIVINLSGGLLTEAATGVAVWRGLTLNVPEGPAKKTDD